MKFLVTIFLIITSLTSQAQITGTWNMGNDNTILQITGWPHQEDFGMEEGRIETMQT